MPFCTNNDCGKRYLGESCPFCQSGQAARRRSIDGRGFGQLSSMFADVERSPIIFSGDVTITNVTGDLVRGDKGPKLIDVGGDYAPSENDSEGADTAISSRDERCPSCGFDITQIEDPLFCPACASTLT